MRDYEVIFILQSDLEEAVANGLVERVSTWITEAGGAVQKVDRWGKRKLAYVIRKQREGNYVLVNAQMPPSFISELERNMRFQEPILRFLVTAAE